MKVLYSQLKKYLPDLKSDPKETAKAFTIIGYMLDKFFEVEYLGKKDYLLDLEVRQNRADCFGVMGLVRELSAYYNIEVRLPEEFITEFSSNSSEKVNIEVRATDSVKRLMGVRISDVQINESPDWLKQYLAFYDINPVNSLVDLTNYVMLETGHPSHAFDWDLIEGGKLFWEINPIFKKMTSLDGNDVELTKDTLLVTNEVEPMAIAGVVGGKNSAINPKTNNILVEMAVYDGGLIRRNSRGMRVMTEASQRLEKFMDPESIPEAFNILVNLILKYTSGKVVSEVYDNYLHPTPKLDIKLELAKVSQIAGLDITSEECKIYLARLGFKVISEENGFLVVQNALNRLDVSFPEDLIEEIVRLKGYDLIPMDKLLVESTKDITPSRVKLNGQVQNMLASRGFDEVRSWVLVDTEKNRLANYSDTEAVNVTNSINEEVPTLRQSISVSLFSQLENYKKNNIPNINIFEIGKVFGKLKNEGPASHSLNSEILNPAGGVGLSKYEEHYSLGMLSDNKDLESLKLNVDYVLRTLGLTEIYYIKSQNYPETAHPATCLDIQYKDMKLGVIYVSNKINSLECIVAEVNLTAVDEIMSRVNANGGIEVESKLVALDVNINLENNQNIEIFVNDKLKSNVDKLWKTEIVDKFSKDSMETKYTVRIYYFGLSDTEAKDLHQKIFEN
ncbi:MAG: phenylalanine--tRNA ligase subunit beta [Candidatus Dojkabacteria bacterium]